MQAQQQAQPFVYPTGLIEVPMSPISDVNALRATLEQHVFTCPACTIYLSQMKIIVSLAGALGEQAPPQAARQPAVAHVI